MIQKNNIYINNILFIKPFLIMIVGWNNDSFFLKFEKNSVNNLKNSYGSWL